MQDHFGNHWMIQRPFSASRLIFNVHLCVEGCWRECDCYSMYSSDGFLESGACVSHSPANVKSSCWPYGCVLTAVCLGHVDLAGRKRYGILHMQMMIRDCVPMEELISKVRPQQRSSSWDWLASESCTLEAQVTFQTHYKPSKLLTPRLHGVASCRLPFLFILLLLMTCKISLSVSVFCEENKDYCTFLHCIK